MAQIDRLSAVKRKKDLFALVLCWLAIGPLSHIGGDKKKRQGNVNDGLKLILFSVNSHTWPRLLWKSSVRKRDSEEFPYPPSVLHNVALDKGHWRQRASFLSIVYYSLSAKKRCLPKSVYRFSVFIQCFERTKVLVKNTWAEYWRILIPFFSSFSQLSRMCSIQAPCSIPHSWTFETHHYSCSCIRLQSSLMVL